MLQFGWHLLTYFLCYFYKNIHVGKSHLLIHMLLREQNLHYFKIFKMWDLHIKFAQNRIFKYENMRI